MRNKLLTVDATNDGWHGLPQQPQQVDNGREVVKKVLSRGARSLRNHELVELILGGRPQSSHRALVERVVSGSRGSQQDDFTLSEARSRYALRKDKAARLIGALELHRRLRQLESRDRPTITTPAEVVAVVPELRGARKEHLVGLYLDAQNVLVTKELISVGSLNVTRSQPREILLPAIEHAALSLILVHNHPSGSLSPSADDIEFTAGVRKAGEIMGIELYDHLIVSLQGHVSLRDRGLL